MDHCFYPLTTFKTPEGRLVLELTPEPTTCGQTFSFGYADGALSLTLDDMWAEILMKELQSFINGDDDSDEEVGE